MTAVPMTALVRDVDEPRHPRLHRPTLHVDLDRGLNVIGFPHLVAVTPGPLQEHVMRPPGTLTMPKSRPVAE